MNIAIYGDSFGCINAEGIADDKNYSWPHLLRQLSGVKFLKNYSKIGKSFISTYSDFLKYKDLYDVNIFLVTNLGRIDFPQLEEICKPYFHNKTDVYITRNNINKQETPILTLEQKELANKLFDYADAYFDVGTNEIYEYLIREAIVEKAMRFSNYTIFIPCFDDHSVPNSKIPLIDIFNFENETLKIDELNGGRSFGEVFDNKFMNDIRQCHLSKENNKVVLDKITQAIETKSSIIDLTIKDFKVPTCDILECVEWAYLP
jgi:hypothetical protein